MANANGKKVRVEVAEETLCRLLRAGQLCAAELRCLDCESKQCLWRLCLESCLKCFAMEGEMKMRESGRRRKSTGSPAFKT